MTLEDIRREIQKDFPIVKRKSIYVCQKLEKQYAQSLKEKQMALHYDYHSKYKNNWIYLMRLVKKKSTISYMVYYEGHRGLTALMPVEQDRLIYSPPIS